MKLFQAKDGFQGDNIDVSQPMKLIIDQGIYNLRHVWNGCQPWAGTETWSTTHR